jgi:uncharacterized membrane protein
MNLADTFSFLFVILGFVIVFVCYWLMAAGLKPEFVQRCAQKLEKSPLSMLVLGAVTLIPLMTIGFAASGKAGSAVLKVAALSLVLLPLLAALFGSAGWALRVGAGLKSDRDEREPWRRVMRGGIVVGITFVLPFIGTFAVLPFVFLSGFGAFLLCAFQRQRAAVTTPAAAPAAPAPMAPLPSPVAMPAPAVAATAQPVLTSVN